MWNACDKHNICLDCLGGFYCIVKEYDGFHMLLLAAFYVTEEFLEKQKKGFKIVLGIGCTTIKGSLFYSLFTIHFSSLLTLCSRFYTL